MTREYGSETRTGRCKEAGTGPDERKRTSPMTSPRSPSQTLTSYFPAEDYSEHPITLSDALPFIDMQAEREGTCPPSSSQTRPHQTAQSRKRYKHVQINAAA